MYEIKTGDLTAVNTIITFSSDEVDSIAETAVGSLLSCRINVTGDKNTVSEQPYV